MMKWKARTETTNIGILELGNIVFDEDYMYYQAHYNKLIFHL